MGLLLLGMPGCGERPDSGEGGRKVTASVPSPPQPEAEAPSALAGDAALIQGDWRFTALGLRGSPSEATVPGRSDRRINFDGIWFSQAGSKDETRTGTFKLDPTRTPKTIDIEYNRTGKGGVPHVRLGIYELKGDRLRIGFGTEDGERPENLERGDIHEYERKAK
jgi:uncharacterized protein (TIGR03067 family)